MLKMHMRTHEQRPPKQPTCSVCQRTFPTKTLLYRHRQTHFEQKTHQCTVCEKRFFSGYALRSHMARHRGERPYICSICLKSFYNPTDLKVSCDLSILCHDGHLAFQRKIKTIVLIMFIKTQNRPKLFVNGRRGESSALELVEFLVFILRSPESFFERLFAAFG